MPNILNKYSSLNDQELVQLIQEKQDYLGEVYKRCKNYSIQFMQKMTNGKMNTYELEDIFQDAIIVLYEKIIKGNFVLTCSLQTYLNSVCRYQLLNKFKQANNSGSVGGDGNSQYDNAISDELDPIIDEKEDQFIAIEKALELMKSAGGKCYDLLVQFWYHKKSMNDLTAIFGYTNEVNTRNQKTKCQKRLEKIAFNELKTN